MFYRKIDDFMIDRVHQPIVNFLNHTFNVTQWQIATQCNYAIAMSLIVIEIIGYLLGAVLVHYLVLNILMAIFAFYVFNKLINRYALDKHGGNKFRIGGYNNRMMAFYIIVIGLILAIFTLTSNFDILEYVVTFIRACVFMSLLYFMSCGNPPPKKQTAFERRVSFA